MQNALLPFIIQEKVSRIRNSGLSGKVTARVAGDLKIMLAQEDHCPPGELVRSGHVPSGQFRYAADVNGINTRRANGFYVRIGRTVVVRLYKQQSHQRHQAKGQRNANGKAAALRRQRLDLDLAGAGHVFQPLRQRSQGFKVPRDVIAGESGIVSSVSSITRFLMANPVWVEQQIFSTVPRAAAVPRNMRTSRGDQNGH